MALKVLDKSLNFILPKVYKPCQKEVCLSPDSEPVIWLKLSENVLMGTQSLCTAGQDLKCCNVLVACTVVPVNGTNAVPIKFLNPMNEAIVIGKNCIVADFKVLNTSFDILQLPVLVAKCVATCVADGLPWLPTGLEHHSSRFQ